jgi:2OG-Fe(II) oxygenase superfamily
MTSWLDLLRQSPSAPPTTASDVSSAAAGFFAQGRLPLNSLSVEVDPQGLLPQPLSPTEAQALHERSEPAHFGLREQTLLDARVRHTGEISADQLSLHWQPGAFAALQRDVARALGVERLDAWLHNLLIYSPGQFFKPHQDTERHPGMVATLVLVWPSAHLGDELRVRLGSEEGRLVSQHLQLPALRWFAFYADCQHEVLPVEEG